jgi:hypothetical protein
MTSTLLLRRKRRSSLYGGLKGGCTSCTNVAVIVIEVVRSDGTQAELWFFTAAFKGIVTGQKDLCRGIDLNTVLESFELFSPLTIQ